MPCRRLSVLVGGLLLVCSFCLSAVAAAAPVTVNLRIEGKTATLFEGPVTTDVRTIDVGDGGGPRTCDGTNGAANPTPGPTRGAAVGAAAAGPGGFSFTGTYSAMFQDILFTTIAGQNVEFDPVTNEFLGEYKNWAFASLGPCQDQISTGDDVLFAYAAFGAPLLRLSGPATVRPGESATLRVTDANAAEAPVPGVSVGGQSTGADGTATVLLAAPGPQAFKASKAGAVRSNRVTVCATSGSDGACGSTTGGGTGGVRDRTAPSSAIVGIKEGQRFARGKGPRRLRAKIASDPSGLLAVKLRLTRTDAGRCTYFSGKAERFRRGRLLDGSRCGAKRGHWFGVGDGATVDYLLPKRLPRGRYVLDVNAIDKAYNRDDMRRRGGNRVVFYVG